MQQKLFEEEEQKPTVSFKSKRELYHEYCKKNHICWSTFHKWLAKMPFYAEIKQDKVLSPKYVALIYLHLGNP